MTFTGRRVIRKRPPLSSATAITYAVVTAHGHHDDQINILLMDASGRTVSSAINWDTWRALGTRAGAETIGDF